jgi:hypothetical protein
LPIVRSLTAIIAALTTAAALAVVGVSTAVTAHADATGCAPVKIVTFRGSGENDAKYNNGEGVTLGKLITRAQTQPFKDGFSAAGVPIFGVPYPAVGLDQFLATDKTDLFQSIEYGRVIGDNYIGAQHQACPNTRFVLLGYSQGVVVAREVAQDVNSDVIGGVIGIADPEQKPNADGVEGPNASGNGLLRWFITQNGTASSDAFYGLPIPKFSYCHDFDAICDIRALGYLNAAFVGHGTYGDDAIELIGLAAVINLFLENATKAGPPAGGVGTGGGGATLAATSVDLQSSANPSTFGQPVTFNAIVSTGSGTPTGSVSFYDGPDPLGISGLSDGHSSFTTATLTPGAHNIIAFYGGDSTHANSSQSLNQTVSKAATTTALTVSPNPSVYCQTVTLHSQVGVVPPGAGAPTGAVTYTDGNAVIGSGNLNANATSAITTQFFSVGTHPLTASYSGDPDFLASISPTVNQVVNRAPTITTVQSAPAATNLFGHSSTFTATVTAPPPGCGSPSGTVNFAVDGVTVQTSALNPSDTATLTTTALVPGNHLVTVRYNGDTNFLPSQGTTTYQITCTHTLTGAVNAPLIASGESTCLVNANLAGAVVVPVGVRFGAVNSRIGGAVTANANGGPNMIALCGTRIGGSTVIEHANELVMVGDPGAACVPTTINGALILRNNRNGVEATGNTVGGSVITSGNAGEGPYGQPTTVTGNI